MDFEDYVRARSPALLRVAMLLTGDQHAAEDLTQTALEDALVHWRRVIRADHPDRYVQRMMLNRFLQGRRRRSGTERVTQDAGQDLLSPDHAGGVADRDQARRLLDALPPRARALLVLRYYLDLDDRAIGDLLGIGPSTVRSTISRTLRDLRPAGAVAATDPNPGEQP